MIADDVGSSPTQSTHFHPAPYDTLHFEERLERIDYLGGRWRFLNAIVKRCEWFPRGATFTGSQ
jgi:hypothetical protein